MYWTRTKPGNLAQGGLISSNETFSYLRGAKCTRAIWGANGSYQIFSNGRAYVLDRIQPFVYTHAVSRVPCTLLIVCMAGMG
jgi:hypothetical protein